jgi:MFS family permease
MFFSVTLPLAAANVINQAARTVMAVVGPLLAVEFGLSASELGVLAACTFASYAVAQLPLGVALDRFGPRRMQTVLMLLTALGFAMLAMAPGFGWLSVARLVIGVGISAGLMAIIKGNADWFAPQKVPNMTGIAVAIGALGSALTTAPVQAVLPALGWRGVFWLLGALTLAVGLWILLRVPEKPHRSDVRRLSFAEEIAISGKILSSRTFWRYGPAVSTLSMLNFAYLGLWAGPWLRDVAGMDDLTRSGVLFFYTLAMMAGSLVSGNLGSRAKSAGLAPFVVPVAGVAGMLAIQIALVWQPSQFFLVTALWLALAFCGTVAPTGYIALGQMFPPEQTGRVSTAINMITLAGAFLLQVAVGWILDLWPRTESGGWHPDGYSWAIVVSIVMHSAALWVMARAPRPGR